MRSKKLLAAKILKVSPKKIKFKAEALEDIGKAITRSDIRGLIAVKDITQSKKPHHSRVRARKIATQKKKGLRKGHGSRKGKKHSKISKKEKWMVKIRAQRKLLKQLRERDLIAPKNYRLVYAKSKGGFFRNRRHLNLYLDEHNLIKK
ncbi:50S ribosomal protein L19e [Candidatus Woesearchaeota archaeon]|nr:50S ribosomal protein L19e [Candidatus Woesearchaeota archaeon]